MRASGAATTCVPVRTDERAQGEAAEHAAGDGWEAALFVQLAGPECKADRRAIVRATGPLPVGLETDIVETETGAVVILRLEVHTVPDDPFACEILLAPGSGGSDFDCLQLLTAQPRLQWFFGDQTFWVLRSQSHALGPEQHAGFDELLKDALKYDTMIRLTKRYDASAALGHVARLYELRAKAEITGAMARGTGSAM